MKSIKRLRVILLCTEGHLGSDLVFNLAQHIPEIEVVGLVQADAVSPKLDKLQGHLKKRGVLFSWLLVWQYSVHKLAYGFSSMIKRLHRGNYMLPAGWLAKDQEIPVFHGSINSDEAAEYISKIEPDLIISAYFNQILKPNVLDLPKLGILNIHPGWLPHYRGAMSYFWALRKNERNAGVSLHWIDQGIDTGGLIAQKKINVSSHTTQHQVLIKTAIIGTGLLRRMVKKILKGKALPIIQVSEKDIAYYSMPVSEDFDVYFKERRFFRIRDAFGIWFRKIKPAI